MAIDLTSVSPQATVKSAPLHCWPLYGLAILSGVAGLGYQITWAKLLSVTLGHEIAAVLATVAAFFAGLALGGLVLNRRVHHTNTPHRWYAVFELCIGLWALAVLILAPQLTLFLPELLGTNPSPSRHWLIAFSSTFLLLLPATATMGATLPALERLAKLTVNNTQQKISALYSANTLGAVLGTLVATFWLIPELGITQTVISLSAINLLCAALVIAVFYKIGRNANLQQNNTDTAQFTQVPKPQTHFNKQWLLGALFFTGLLGIGLEVIMIRALSQVLENTVYTYASILAVYLIGTSAGAWCYHKTPASKDWPQRLVLLIAAVLTAGVFALASLWWSPDAYLWVIQHLGHSRLSALTAEWLVAALAFLLPTLAMGALFCHLVQQVGQKSGYGLAFAVNTLGAAVAPWLFGVFLLPLLGIKLAAVLVVLGYLAILPVRHCLQCNWRIKFLIAPPVLATLAITFFAGPLTLLNLGPQERILEYREGVMASVAVIEDGQRQRHLKVNNRFTMGGTATSFSDHRQSHLPLLLHGKPQTALYLGLGTGKTFEAVQFYPSLTAIGVELIPEAIDVMPYFGVEPSAWPMDAQVVSADARRYVLASEQLFDVIIAEIFHPSRDGAGALYTKEHFSAVSQRLAEDGLFCQWLPLFQLDINTLKTITRTFVEVFPYSQLHLGHFSLQQPILCLLGSNQPLNVTDNWLFSQVTDTQLQQQLINQRLNSDFALLGGMLADKNQLQTWAGPGAINTDNNPIITYSAPDFVYAERESAALRLSNLITELQALPNYQQQMAAPNLSQAFMQRLQRYWQARDIFLQAGVNVDPSKNLPQLLSTIKTPLLQAVRTSPDFLPAYQPLLAMAEGLYPQDPKAAWQLLKELEEANPQLPFARQMRMRLFGN